jgi:predicted nucleotidyltransferase
MGILDAHFDSVAAICRRFGVAKLELIGSATTANSLDECGDVDLLVSFHQPQEVDLFNTFFPLRDALSEEFGKPVDLIEPTAIRNPAFKRVVDQSRTVFYAA